MKFLDLIKKPIVIFFIIIAAAAAAGGYYYTSREKETSYNYEEAKRGDLVQEVSVTGTVEPAESVDLSFEKSGKVKEIKVKIGDKVQKDQVLIFLENSDLSAQLSQAWADVENARANLSSAQASLSSVQAQLEQAGASLEAEQAELSEMRAGTRPEEIKIAETAVANAQKSLADTIENLENTEEKAEADLEEDYDSALTAAQQAVTKGKTAILTLTDIQYAHFTENDTTGIALADAKAKAVESLLGQQNAGRWARSSLSALQGGVYGAVQNGVEDMSYKDIDQALADTVSALKKVKSALEAVPLTSELTSTEQTNISTEKNTINTEISAVSSKQQAISVQKAANESNIASAQSGVNEAQNSLDSAEDELALARAGYTAEQIAAQEAAVKQSQANVSSKEALLEQARADVASRRASIRQALASVENYQAQIEKTIMRSPIEGIITKKEAKVGEIISANKNMISIISENNFEIEANVAEVDIANLKVGNQATVTLDAYGPDREFSATIVEIDPAETIIEGVPTYRTVLQFDQEDGAIKSGMTANIDILAEKKENVLSVPQRAVLREEGKKIVRVINPDNTYRKVEVQTGLRGSSGYVEIISGLKEGDKVVVYILEED